jgi:hypothetical protein
MGIKNESSSQVESVKASIVQRIEWEAHDLWAGGPSGVGIAFDNSGVRVGAQTGGLNFNVGGVGVGIGGGYDVGVGGRSDVGVGGYCDESETQYIKLTSTVFRITGEMRARNRESMSGIKGKGLSDDVYIQILNAVRDGVT